MYLSVIGKHEIERKLKRILAFESRRPNYFKQHITDIKNYLITEINNEGNKDVAN